LSGLPWEVLTYAGAVAIARSVTAAGASDNAVAGMRAAAHSVRTRRCAQMTRFRKSGYKRWRAARV
jgi:hypothetical protein